MSDLAALNLVWVRDPAHIDLTSRQWAMLGMICDYPGPHSVKAISEALRVSKPVVTRMHNTLSKMGLVIRVADPKDLRKASVAPTEKGEQLRHRVPR